MMILKKLCYGLSGSLFLASSLLTISHMRPLTVLA